MLLASLFVAAGQFFWKFSYGHSLLYIIAGFFAYGLGALLMMVAFHYGKLSVVHPVLSMSYVFGAVISYFILREVLIWRQYAGILVIMVGVFMIAGGDHE